jgi:hypothetical protein
MHHDEPLCKPDAHVWRRHESERNQRVSRYSLCDCQRKQFKDVGVNATYAKSSTSTRMDCSCRARTAHTWRRHRLRLITHAVNDDIYLGHRFLSS